MITFTWYNLVAIVVAFIFYLWFHSIDDRGYLGWLGYVLPIFCLVVFYLIWGGIFWW